MKLGDGKGIKAGRWLPNEMFVASDINFAAALAVYENAVDLLSMFAEQGVATGSTKDTVIAGMLLEHSTALTCYLRAGAAVSFAGKYLNNDVWGFVSEPGSSFAAVIPDSQVVAFDAGGTYQRLDVLEVRPVVANYSTETRQFKDPVTQQITSALTETRRDYSFEFQILKGDDSKNLAHESVVWTVNSATVGSNVSGKYVLFSTYMGDYYVWFNTDGGSSDPAIAGRVGIEVAVAAADNYTTIASKADAALDAAKEGKGYDTLSYPPGQFVVWDDRWGDRTDGTNGDMGSLFDAIVVNQGHGAQQSTAGWIKLAEVYVAASASSIDQDDIKDVRDSAEWNEEVASTVLRRTEFSETLFDSSNAAEARTTLDVYSKAEVPNPTIVTLTVHDNVVKGDPIVLWPGGRYRKAPDLGMFNSVQITDMAYCLSHQIVRLTPTKFVVMADDLTATARYNRPIVITLNVDGTLSVGSTGSSVNSDAGPSTWKRLLRLDDNRFLYLYQLSNANMLACVGTESSGSVSWGTPITISTQTTTAQYSEPILFTVDSGYEYVLVGYAGGASNYIWLKAIKVDGTTLTTGAEYQFTSVTATPPTFIPGRARSTSNQAVFYIYAYYYETSATLVKVRRVSIDLGTLATSAATAITLYTNSGSVFYPTILRGGTYRDKHVMLGISGSLGMGMMIVSPGVSTSYATMVLGPVAGPASYGSLHNVHAFGDGKLAMLSGYRQDPFSHFYLFIADAETLSVKRVNLYGVEQVGEAPSELVDNHTVIGLARENTTFDLYVGLVHISHNFIGVAMETISSGNSGRVAVAGFVDGFSNLEVGEPYYLYEDGTVDRWYTADRGESGGDHDEDFIRAVQIGVAVTSDTLLLERGK